MLRKIPQNETLAERAYEELKKAIMQQVFLPGDLLPEESIASMLGISRTPLRRAINKLAFDGLVEVETGKIARVSNFDEKDLEHFIRLRKLLEVFACEEAIPFVTEEFIQSLEENRCKQIEAIENQDYYRYIELDSQFHMMIAEITQIYKLKDFVEQICNHFLRFLVLSQTIEQSVDEALEEHKEIILALSSRDVVRVRKAMETHIENVEKRAKMKQGRNKN